ncbi:MAG: hypothetical protein RBT55_15860 [Rhodocyclaceae bacterium]|jgi:hypothetical protein|nr:hypothetical protein [Rhodocyclaceae bacterium]HRP76660.1 hypothetical protein [Rhodocyclaceae bacterium]HRQ35127.1 hypothetical protein [Chiayiivirga sp.]
MKNIFIILVIVICASAALLIWKGEGRAPIDVASKATQPESSSDEASAAQENSATITASRNGLPMVDGDGSAEFLSLSLDKQAAILMGFDLAGHESVLEYFYSLEDDFNSGNATAAVVAARLYSRCRVMGQDEYSRINQDHPSYPVAKACSAFPDRGQDYSSELIEKAAAMGVRDAVIAQFLYPPSSVVANPEHEVSAEWVSSAIARLDKLASRGDLEAIKQLALVYMQSEFGVKDNKEAVRYLSMYVKMSPPNDPNRSVMQSSINSICGRVVFDANANPCED